MPETSTYDVLNTTADSSGTTQKRSKLSRYCKPKNIIILFMALWLIGLTVAFGIHIDNHGAQESGPRVDYIRDIAVPCCPETETVRPLVSTAAPHTDTPDERSPGVTQDPGDDGDGSSVGSSDASPTVKLPASVPAVSVTEGKTETVSPLASTTTLHMDTPELQPSFTLVLCKEHVPMEPQRWYCEDQPDEDGIMRPMVVSKVHTDTSGNINWITCCRVRIDSS